MWFVRFAIKVLLFPWLRHHTDQTNATFFRRGTKQTYPRQLRPFRWHWLPGYQRLGIASCIFWAPIWLIYGWFWQHTTTVIVLVGLGVISLALGGWRGYQRFQSQGTAPRGDQAPVPATGEPAGRAH